MRIVHLVTRGECGGAQSIVRSLAEAQSKSGHEVAIAYGPEAGDEAWRGLPGDVRLEEAPSLVRQVRPISDLRAVGEVARIFREDRPQILHLHTSKAGAIGRLARRPTGAKIVYTMHGYDQIRVVNRAFLPVERFLRGKADALVAVSSRDAVAMEADGLGPVRCIPNGIDEPRMAGGEAGEDFRRIDSALAEMAKSQRAIVLVIARAARPKRVDLAREIGELIRDRAIIAWVGNGDPFPDGPGIRFLGSARNASGLLKHAKVFLLPTDHEGLPVSVIEAMAASVPVVASAVGGVPEALEAGGGTAASPSDAADHARAIAGYLSDPVRMESEGARGRAAWEARYSARLMQERYSELYEGLLADQGRA